MRDMTHVAVVGASGYSGLELARILLRHPGLSRRTFYLRETGGAKCLGEGFSQFRGTGDAPVRELSVSAIAESGAGVAFLATPDEASRELAPQLLEAGLRVVDLSGAFRFRSGETFSRWYKQPAAEARWLEQAVYGLPELHAEKIGGAALVANPGCYATSVILALRPLASEGWIDAHRGVICDCKSGASGAGKELRRDLQFVEVDENFRAYGLFSHRHTPEILEQVGMEGDQIMFTTHMLPISRGILSTIYVWLKEAKIASEVEAAFRRYYTGRPMVRIWPAGQLPEVQHVAHTNFCDIGFALDAAGERLIVVSCLDNLGKGAAGQAVQNFNLMAGMEERTALQ